MAELEELVEEPGGRGRPRLKGERVQRGAARFTIAFASTPVSAP